MAKRIKYKIGDVFLIPISDKLSGVGRVLRKNMSTILIEMYQMKPIKNIHEYRRENILSSKPLVIHWCYDDGIKSGIWQIVDYQEVPDKIEMPYFWTQDAGNGKYFISKGTESSFRTDAKYIEISKEETYQYETEGIGNEISEVKRYIRRLTEAGLLEVSRKEENQGIKVKEMKILDEDVAADVEAAFMELLEEGIKGEKATKEILEEFSEELEDEEDRNVVYLALAELQLGENCLQEDIREKALEIIESGADLERWEEAEEKDYESRKAVLDDLKERLINSR